MTNFAIYGVNFFNKGAELMLHACRQQVYQWDKDNSLSAHLQIGSMKQRKQAGLDHLLWLYPRERLSRKSRMANLFYSVLDLAAPKQLLRKYDIVTDPEVDVILDASGFAFSDQWGALKTEMFARNCLRWKKQGKKIILLPQAFGPFTERRIQEAFKTVIDSIDLIFARDQVSYNYVKKLSPHIGNLRLAPDFTNLLLGATPDYIDQLVGRPCIIPNKRMLDKTIFSVNSNYISFLVLVITHLLKKGLHPFILIHESNDFDLSLHLQSIVGKKVQIIQENDPIYLKGILGNCEVVIGSRFHGLVSALSQGIPCIGTGWSHKYRQLFDNYKCSDFLVKLGEDHDKTTRILDSLTEKNFRNATAALIQESANVQKERSRNMWAEVENFLELSSHKT
ncbi:MAG: polysaccharide pyruvyl transferase family protein [Cyanobacteria bacterium P01_D01_bin.14]